MAIEIVDLPIKNGWIFHSYVSLPEGNPLKKPTDVHIPHENSSDLDQAPTLRRS